jgi:hypothetical protein
MARKIIGIEIAHEEYSRFLIRHIYSSCPKKIVYLYFSTVAFAKNYSYYCDNCREATTKDALVFNFFMEGKE